MSYLKQLGYDFIELLLVNGTRTSRLVFFWSSAAAGSLTDILFETATDTVSAVMALVFSGYLLYVTYAKRSKDLGFSLTALNCMCAGIIFVSLVDIHDYLIYALVIAVIVYTLVLTLKSGENDINQYGDSPLKEPKTLTRLKWNSFFIFVILLIISMAFEISNAIHTLL